MDRIITITESVEQMDKRQDHTRTGEIFIDGVLVKYAVVFDGHGQYPIIDFIQSIDDAKMREIMTAECPATTMFDYINAQTPKLCRLGQCSGSTMCMARIYPTHIEIINVGDSQAVVFKNGKLEFISETHEYANEKEKARLDEEGRLHETLSSTGLKIVNETEMYITRTVYISHKNDGVTLAISQALGHDGKTGIAPSREVIPYKAEDEMRIILGSDGVFDMILREQDSDAFIESDLLAMVDMSAQEIVKRAVDRWLQPWNMHHDLNNLSLYANCQFERKHCDDIAAIKIDVNAECSP